MERVSVRRATAEDWPAVAEIHAESWRSAYRGIYPNFYLDGEAEAERRLYWREALAAWDPQVDAVFLAEDEVGRALGFAALRCDDPAGPLLDNLHVRPTLRGGGIGRNLIASAAAWLAAKDPEAPLQLLVWAANAPARRFYARLGGTEVETIAGALPGGGTAPEIRVRWSGVAALAALA